MRFTWEYTDIDSQMIKIFLKKQGISKGLLAKIKFQGGQILVNGTEVNVLYQLQQNDVLEVEIPNEQEHETLLRDEQPIDVVYEDEHLLIVNKPAGLPSIPAQYHPNRTMANRVKNYICERAYPNQVVHIVTRLDKDTSGLMLFAKHGYAHALFDQALRSKTLIKKYQALVLDELDIIEEHGLIDGAITRDLSSLIKRKVASEGKPALTEYWLEKTSGRLKLVDIQLHTGRTHQIRVHFAHLGCPLLGDELYGGSFEFDIGRQALHCYELSFNHPFTKEDMKFNIPLAKDMAQIIS